MIRHGLISADGFKPSEAFNFVGNEQFEYEFAYPHKSTAKVFYKSPFKLMGR